MRDDYQSRTRNKLVAKVFKREGISSDGHATMPFFEGKKSD